MRVALVNPPWSFEGSIYSACREPHLPLEFGYARALVEQAGHEAVLVDAHMEGLRATDVRRRLEALEPAITVVTTAPSYLFWRCAPPELRVPQQLVGAVRDVAGTLVVVGPHGTTTPRATLRKLGAHAAVLGDCEEVIARLVATPRGRWGELESVALVEGSRVRVSGEPAECDVARLPALAWAQSFVDRHAHQHHRFDRPPTRPGAEIEVARDGDRRRPLDVVLRELDGLCAQGVEYVYVVDERLPPDRELLDALAEREVAFGVRVRIEDWDDEALARLGEAGCVSLEAMVEGVSLAGPHRGRMERIEAHLAHARRSIPSVQATLVAAGAGAEHADDVAHLRHALHRHGVCASEPLPGFPYPGTSEYELRWGPPDDLAWERAHAHYLAQFRAYADVGGSQPISLSQLELPDPA